MAKNKNNAPAKPALAPADALYQAVSLCRKAGEEPKAEQPKTEETAE